MYFTALIPQPSVASAIFAGDVIAVNVAATEYDPVDVVWSNVIEVHHGITPAMPISLVIDTLSEPLLVSADCPLMILMAVTVGLN